jgi:hypothetical protein
MAVESYRKALAVRQHMLGENHPDSVAIIERLADLCYSNGDYASATSYRLRLMKLEAKSFRLWSLEQALEQPFRKC